MHVACRYVCVCMYCMYYLASWMYVCMYVCKEDHRPRRRPHPLSHSSPLAPDRWRRRRVGRGVGGGPDLGLPSETAEVTRKRCCTAAVCFAWLLAQKKWSPPRWLGGWALVSASPFPQLAIGARSMAPSPSWPRSRWWPRPGSAQ